MQTTKLTSMEPLNEDVEALNTPPKPINNQGDLSLEDLRAGHVQSFKNNAGAINLTLTDKIRIELLAPEGDRVDIHCVDNLTKARAEFAAVKKSLKAEGKALSDLSIQPPKREGYKYHNAYDIDFGNINCEPVHNSWSEDYVSYDSVPHDVSIEIGRYSLYGLEISLYMDAENTNGQREYRVRCLDIHREGREYEKRYTHRYEAEDAIHRTLSPYIEDRFKPRKSYRVKVTVTLGAGGATRTDNYRCDGVNAYDAMSRAVRGGLTNDVPMKRTRTPNHFEQVADIMYVDNPLTGKPTAYYKYNGAGVYAKVEEE